MSDWLHWLAILSLALAVISALVIIVDLVRGHQQQMWIMNIVWPITALYAGPLAAYAYFAVGRASSRRAMKQAKEQGLPKPAQRRPFWQTTALAATHCGGGCTLGDLVVEWTLFFVPLTVLGYKIFGSWIVDFIVAFAFGIAFQYFTIKPMRNLSPKEGLKEAVKADSLSLASWQLGMYGWMAIVTFAIYGHELDKTNPVFWFMMQIAMLFGFLTSYPVNWWLLKKGIKEKM